eukprot:scaffold10101_cov105-Isochrysis_galbana.AAC.1
MGGGCAHRARRGGEGIDVCKSGDSEHIGHASSSQGTLKKKGGARARACLLDVCPDARLWDPQHLLLLHAARPHHHRAEAAVRSKVWEDHVNARGVATALGQEHVLQKAVKGGGEEGAGAEILIVRHRPVGPRARGDQGHLEVLRQRVWPSKGTGQDGRSREQRRELQRRRHVQEAPLGICVRPLAVCARPAGRALHLAVTVPGDHNGDAGR